MDDARELELHGDDGKSAQPVAGSVAAWLAQRGMVVLLAVEASTPTGHTETVARPKVESARESADSTPDQQPEQALRVRLSAQKLWAEGRANPVWYVCRSWIGDWQTEDRVTWHSTDRIWLAQLQRSPNGRHVFLRLWHNQTLVGHQDEAGWHPAAARARPRQPRPVQRSLPLPLAG